MPPSIQQYQPAYTKPPSQRNGNLHKHSVQFKLHKPSTIKLDPANPILSGKNPSPQSSDSSSFGPPPGFSKPLYKSFVDIVKGNHNKFDRREEQKTSEQGQQTESEEASAMNLGSKSDMAKRTIFIANLSRRITETVLRNFCRTKGNILGLSIKQNAAGGVFAFVRYEEDVDINEVIGKLNGVWIMDRKIVVERAKKDLIIRVLTTIPREMKSDDNRFLMKKRNVFQVLELFADKVCVADNEWAVKLISTEFKNLKKVHDLCINLDICFKLISRKGRYCIIVVLNDEFSVKKLLDNHECFKHDFVKVERIGAFSEYSRINWIEVHGFANELWTEENFTKISEKWGSWIFTAGATVSRKRWDKAFILVEVKQLNIVDEVLEIMYDHKFYKIRVCENDVEDELCIKEVFDFWMNFEGEIHSPLMADSIKTPRISSGVGLHSSADRGLGLTNVAVNSKDSKLGKINLVVQESPLNNSHSQDHVELNNFDEGYQKLHRDQDTVVNVNPFFEHGNDCLCNVCMGFKRKALLQQKQNIKANEKVKNGSMKIKDHIFSFKKRGRPTVNKNSQKTGKSDRRNGKNGKSRKNAKESGSQDTEVDKEFDSMADEQEVFTVDSDFEEKMGLIKKKQAN